MWLSYKAVKEVKHRHRIFHKYKNPLHPACKQANRRATKEVHHARRNFENKLATNVKGDKKSFLPMLDIRQKVKLKPCLDSHGTEITDTYQIAELFNVQFSSVFAYENRPTNAIPTRVSMYSGSNTNKLKNDIRKRLFCLREHKSPGDFRLEIGHECECHKALFWVHCYFLFSSTTLTWVTLQKDLDTLCGWAENWQITFNVNKCKVMDTGTNNRNYG